MLAKTALLGLLPAFTAATAVHQHPHPARAVPGLALHPRQTNTPTEKCIDDVLSAIEAAVSPFPPTPRELVGMTDINPIDNPCDYTPPASMASAFTSYSREVVSWVSESWPKVTSALAACGSESSEEVDGFARAWNLIVCTTDVNEGGAGSKPTTATTTTTTGEGAVKTTAAQSGSGSETTGTGTGTGTAPTGSTSSSTAGAARETGLVAGIVAVVGFVGAVAAL